MTRVLALLSVSAVPLLVASCTPEPASPQVIGGAAWQALQTTLEHSLESESGRPVASSTSLGQWTVYWRLQSDVSPFEASSIMGEAEAAVRVIFEDHEVTPTSCGISGGWEVREVNGLETPTDLQLTAEYSRADRIGRVVLSAMPVSNERWMFSFLWKEI